VNAPRRQKPDRRGRKDAHRDSISARLRTLPPTPDPVKPAANPIDGAGVPRAPAFGKIDGMTAVSAAQGRGRHQPGADAFRGAWTRI